MLDARLNPQPKVLSFPNTESRAPIDRATAPSCTCPIFAFSQRTFIVPSGALLDELTLLGVLLASISDPGASRPKFNCHPSATGHAYRSNARRAKMTEFGPSKSTVSGQASGSSKQLYVNPAVKS